MNTKSQTTPRFSEVFAEAERLALWMGEQWMAGFIASDGSRRYEMVASMTRAEAERYDKIMAWAFDTCKNGQEAPAHRAS